jgi:hypothetical protein
MFIHIMEVGMSTGFWFLRTNKMTKSNYLSFWEYLKKIKILWTYTPPLRV